MGERVNKIMFVGSINKEIRLEVSVRVSDFWKREKTHRREKTKSECCNALVVIYLF